MKNEILELLDLSRSNTHKTHGSMGSIKGSYGLNRYNLDTIFNNYEAVDKYWGLQEKPTNYSMFRCDLDYKSGKDDEEQPDLELITSNFLLEVRKLLNLFLVKSNTISKSNDRKLDAIILSKPSYIDPEKGIRKFGIHIQFPHIFISKEEFKFLEEEIKKTKFHGFDPICSKPWLMYGQHKNNYSGTYTISHIDVGGKKVNPIEYFVSVKYKIYDIKTETPISYTKENIENYYPQILSILSNNREDSEINIPTRRDKSIEVVEDDDKELSDEDLENIKHDCRLLLGILDKSRIDDHNDWLQVGMILFNISNGHHNFLDLWKDWSSSYKYYKEDELEHKWDRFDKRVMGLPSLKKNAKEDNPTEYSKISKLFKVKYEHEEKGDKREFNKIDLDNIYPDEIINQNNIGSYIPRLEKADITLVRSNMMTFKTQNFKELLKTEGKKYRRILVVSFRVSLINEYMKNFEEHNFKLYSDFSGKIMGDRIVCQIDSLHKVFGEFELMLLDEIEYTQDHLHSFVKQKQQVWDSLNQYIDSTKKIIVCDALLSNKTCEFFKSFGRTTHIVENKWKSFSGTVNYHPWQSQTVFLIHLLNSLKHHKSIFIPTNSKTFALKLFLFLQKKGIKVGLDSSESENPTPSSEWKNYEVFITTPTNIAGISCNDEFGKTIGYATSNSCSAKSFAQMLKRVRNTTCKNMDIFIKSNCNYNIPTKLEDVKKYIEEKDDLIFQVGFKLNHIRNKIEEDDYYNQYVNFLQSQNKSKIWFKETLKGILEHHGYESYDVEEVSCTKEYEEKTVIPDLLQDEENEVKLNNKTTLLEVINKEIKTHLEEFKTEKRNEVINARLLTQYEFKTLEEKYHKTLEEKAEIRKYHLTNAYGKDDLEKYTNDFIKKFEPKIDHFYNLIHLNTSNEMIPIYITNELDTFLKEHKKDPNTQRLNEKHKLIKIWACHNILNELGFNNVWDTKEINGYPYEKALDFCKKYYHKISLLSGNYDNRDWRANTI